MAALNLTTGSTVTLDESANLQNLAATPAAPGDSNDNDISASSLPTAFSTRLTAQGAGTAINAALSGYNGTNTGTNAFTFTVTGTVTDMSFTDANGAPLNGQDSGLNTADGENIFLYTDTTNNNVVYGKTALNVVVFAAYLEETGSPVSGAKIWTVQYEAISNPDATNADDPVDLTDKIFVSVSKDTEFNLADAPSGQNLFLMFTTDTPTIVDGRITNVSIIATGRDPANQSGANFNSTADDININTGDTINTSKAGGPTTFGTNSQMITEQEGIRFTFVTGARADVTIPNLDQNEADLESNIDFTGMFGATTADFDVVQLQGGKSAQVRISAFSTAVESGNSFVEGYANDTMVSITSVRVLDSAGNVLETYSAGAEGALSSTLAISITGGIATITGVVAGQSIEYTTTANHNRVLIENGAALDASGNTHADFDIGGFRLLRSSTATAEIGSQMVFEDDGPSIAVADTAPPDALTVDETVLATNASANFADNFSSTPSYGTDGAGTVTSVYALSLKTSGADSGLDDVATGNSVFLFLNASGVVEGRQGTDAIAAATGDIVFTVSVSATGTVTLDQQRAIVHPDTTNPDDSKTLSAADLIVLTRTDTITDQDGDQAMSSDFLNIGQALNFEDDGPSIGVADTAPPDALTVDETILATNASANFADNFSSTPSYGADGAGTVTSAYALGVKSAGVASGLVDTLTNQSVVLTLTAGGVVEGRTAISGALVFTVSVSATGTVTLDQQRAIVHPDITNPDDSKTLAAADLIVLTRTDTITDKDGDQAMGSDFLNIGQALNFEDDGPSIGVADIAPPDALTVDETILATNASASFADNFSSSPSYGADGAGTVTSAYALTLKTSGADSGLDDVATGNSVFLFLNASGVVEGRQGTDAVAAATGSIVFTVSVSAAGLVTLDQQRAIVHPDTNNPDDSKTLAAADLIVLTRTDTITDKDGDQATGSDFLNIGQALNFEDDGPSIGVADTAPPDALTVDETILATNASANFADNFSSTPSYGADGAGTVTSAYALSVKSAGVASGLVDTLTNQSVVLTLTAGGVVEGRTAISGALVFTVSVSAAGLVTLDQQRAVVHPDTTNPDDSKTLSAADLIVLTRTDTITDRDGDQAMASDFLNIGQALNFEDDGPSIVVADTAPPDALTVDETILATNASASFADNFSSTPSYGADGAGTVSSAYTLGVKSPGVASGLVDTLTNQSVVLTLTAGGVVEGRTAISGALVFTVSVSAAGLVTLDQQRAIVHPDATNPDDSTTLSAADLIVLTRTDTITDKDGDQAMGADFLNIGQALNFEDDGPTIVARTDLIYSNTSNPAPGGTGVFDYEIGADARSSYSLTNSDFSAITLTGTVGSAAIGSPTVTWTSETATGASFAVSFSYKPDPSSATTTNATGTLSFDKVNGTYSLTLNAPIAGFNTVSTGQALGFTGYTLGTSTVDQTQPDVSVAQLSSNFFVQFTGYNEPGGGTGAKNIQAIAPAAPLGTANGTTFANGELFKQEGTWVSVSNQANGVASDTIQQGEVLDLDFFAANPFGFATTTPTTQAAGMFLKFDGIGSEDLVLVLKLVDPDDGSRTTKAIIIDNADIIKFGGTIPAPYSIVLDNNDGAIIIESNDFNTGTENYVIEGAQLLVSTEDVTGTAINLNPLTGAGGGSTTFQEFSGTPGTANPEAATTDNDVIKISDIGFVTLNSGQLDANLQFSLAVQDADGDATATQMLDVGIVGGTVFTGGADNESIQGSAGNDTLTGGLGKDALTGGDGNDVYDFNAVAESPAGANKDVVSGFTSGADTIDLSGIDAISGNANANDAFSYLAGAAFTNVAGQLRFDVATQTLQADVDGNGGADFEVQLVGVVAPPPLSDLVV
ncbi:DUF5801 repeats-in-toxin domain-containing protein [Variovorax sp. EBFNA2]|uniref:DUF5801 repeats-in-toxin domain-containing protein n=1 Tax=Variovorax sp. EBFNA2 TaxID=3342097 RepID=UPI0029C0CFCE|nr:DUF5801 repeats-in-toxin domain-containing protein [Variovorax boronicumulans]WPG39667.1 DUF5801 repeats-in-toxin domain-containing protein [Variovorax boronicumulans]